MSGAPAAPCGRCGGELGERQRWCLRCGQPALTVVATPRRWAAVTAAATLIAALALAGIVYAIAALASA